MTEAMDNGLVRSFESKFRAASATQCGEANRYPQFYWPAERSQTTEATGEKP